MASSPSRSRCWCWNCPSRLNTVPLIPALLEAWPDFLGYIMSFAFIGGIWLTHSGLTRFMKRGDTVANAANLLLLLFVALLPFTTSVMAMHLSSPDIGPAVLLYGINVLLASLTLSLLIRYIAHDPSLVADDIADETLQRITKQRWISIAVNSIAVVMALIAPAVAVGLYLIQTVLLLVFPLVGMRRHKPSNDALLTTRSLMKAVSDSRPARLCCYASRAHKLWYLVLARETL